MLPLVVGVEGADRVVLADRAVHADGPLRDGRAEGGVGAVDVAEGALVHRDRGLDGGDRKHLYTSGGAGKAAAGRNRREDCYLTALLLEEITWKQGTERAGGRRPRDGQRVRQLAERAGPPLHQIGGLDH